MAAQKKGSKPAPKQTAAKKKPAQKPAQAAKKNTKQQKPQSKPPQSNSMTAVRERENRRFWSYILFFFGILELLITFVEGDGLWKWLHELNRGLFGVTVFLFAPMIIYVALMIASDVTHNKVIAKVVEGSVLMLLISGMAQIIQVGSVDGSSFWLKLVGLFNDGKQLRGGGLASALLGWPLLSLFKRVGAGIVIVLVAFTFIMLLTNVTLPQLLKAVSKPFVKSYEAVNEERIERAAQPPKPPREKKEPRRNGRVDIAKFYPDDDPDTAAEAFVPVAEEEEAADKVDASKIDMPVHPVKAPVITHEKLEETAKTTDNEELKKIIENAIGDSREEKKSKDEPVKPPVVNVDKNGQTTFFEKDNKISAYVYPPVDILKYAKNPVASEIVQQEIQEKSAKLVETLETYGAKTRIVGIHRGPSVTRYELQPAAGVRVSKITGLADDIALNLAAMSVRIEAPVPGKACIGIEVPNDHRDTVSLRELIDSEEYRKAKGKLTFAVGKDIEGNIIIGDIAKMPHMLVAGTTGSGKSVFTNSIILSILYHASPDEVKLILIDPKKVEFPIYNKIPHLLIPVVTEPLKAAGALGWAVNEMNKRYLMFEANNVKNLQEFNDMVLEERNKPAEEQDEVRAKIDLLPQIVIVVDEFADLMMAARSEVEDSVLRLAQLARAAGIHMIIATQSPRADVLTGLIKSNIPSRVSLSVSSNVDSRVILDESGAEKLLGNGDLLYKPVGVKKPIRMQSGYAATSEIREVVNFLKNEHTAEYSDEVIAEVEENTPQPKDSGSSGSDNVSVNPDDDLVNQAISIIVQTNNASTAFLQRKLKLGFPRAARIMDEIEEMGIIGPQEGSKARKINITKEEWAEMQARR
ncbi:FtsK/SpoIIIE family DNA translocase [Ruminococcus bicirculans (ex Wegman et al. 2014)]|jgi:S-DNA-T family DNA segregation ATPase FtsK/SpoIIIE|uniref:FtsK/SpoIIIE family DNA translocase n=1 Tax=Ruminococcus bicirculans (ex Wegman et al. 2014) TaxID=1160721 RepID=UPI001649528C|nr:DNA translocase FtsK [Ruminococcus bicirculans (ex Wegman et al. 2014)]MBC3513347.1 DNA translocase FtsK [Ruminococcus bicirculans (ex Wegman et al. 2014)]